MNEPTASAHLSGVTSKSSNATHRKRLARRYAEASGRTYAAALDVVRRAADAGRLPEPLDEDGMTEALAILMTVEQTAAEAAQSPLATEQPAAPGQHPVDVALALVTNAPDRRVASDPRDQRIWDYSWAYERLTGSQGLVYISSPGQGADRYVFGGRFTALGRAEAEKHITGLVDALRQRDDLLDPTEQSVRAVQTGQAVAGPNRRPYVGEGADGARRSAEIDRSEADGYDADDPRRAECLASAQRWEAQARRIETEEPPAVEKVETAVWRVAHEGNPVPRCTDSSWRGTSKGPYGPGGYNRCVKAAGHDESGDPHHVDEWGNVYRRTPSFRVVQNISSAEVAEVARAEGMRVSDGSGIETIESPLPKP